MTRPDSRAPLVIFNWGKMRDGEKHDPLELFFDKVDFRLNPIHPYIHLLRGREMSEAKLIAEADARYGWKERRARDYLPSLLKLKDPAGLEAVNAKQDGHEKVISLVREPVPAESADKTSEI
jgi:hypothetical protein